MVGDDVIWISALPTFRVDAEGVEATLRGKAHEYTFRFPRSVVRQAAGDVILLLDADERKPANVRPFKRRQSG